MDAGRPAVHPPGDTVSDWTEEDSATFREIASVAVPRRAEMLAAILALIPYGTGEAFKVVDIGSGDGRLGAALLDGFPQATLLALDGSEAMRAGATRLLRSFERRAAVRSFELASPDWWDLMRGADVIVSSLALHHLNDEKKQYLFRAAAERISARGALLVADLVEPQHPIVRRLFEESWEMSARQQADATHAPDQLAAFHAHRWNHFRFPDSTDHPSPLFFQLVWLKHAGFAIAECVWAAAGHVVYGGFKSADRPASPPLSYAAALESVRHALALHSA
jgi:tRNA (cmo5U34)-methyltransferase